MNVCRTKNARNILPEELQEYLIEATKHIGTKQIKDMVESIRKSMENPDNFLSASKEVLEQYLAYKQVGRI